MLQGRRILLVIAGGIAAYKSLELVRRLREHGATVRCILTRAAQEFVTPLSVSTLSRERVFTDLFSLTDEHEIGHIRLARDCDLVVVAPATADLVTKAALGIADDLASTVLLATDRPLLLAPAMNHVMWSAASTQTNIATLVARGATLAGPNAGPLAEGETGIGRMAEPHEILAAIEALLGGPGPLAGLHALVTSGPTHEPIDPVRYIANRSSGKQGHAIAAALAAAGARTTLVSGPTRLADPQGVAVLHVETAAQMLAACEAALPADIAVCAAAVADWRVATAATQKLKKTGVSVVSCGANNPFAYKPSSKTLGHWVRDMLSLQKEADKAFAIIPDFVANCGMARTFAYLMTAGSSTDEASILSDTGKAIDHAMVRLMDGHKKKTGLLERGYSVFIPD
jgi:phosphopantothenoylcysteine decarboxylase/phosphopantothenate--cysteine ligase